MAIPVLYWMLECTACGSRLVVHDSYYAFIGNPDRKSSLGTDNILKEFDAMGRGYGGPPLTERYTCKKGCAQSMKAIGWVHSLTDETMWLQDSRMSIKMTRAQRKEWMELTKGGRLIGGGDTESIQEVDWWDS